MPAVDCGPSARSMQSSLSRMTPNLLALLMTMMEVAEMSLLVPSVIHLGKGNDARDVVQQSSLTPAVIAFPRFDGVVIKQFLDGYLPH